MERMAMGVELSQRTTFGWRQIFFTCGFTGWDNDETQNVRPAQWLGFLKAVSMTGAGIFSLQAIL